MRLAHTDTAVGHAAGKLRYTTRPGHYEVLKRSGNYMYHRL